MSIARGPLFVLHAIFATVLVIALIAHLGERERDLERAKTIAQQEHEETVRLNQSIEQRKALLDGLSGKDPYVVELLVRDKLMYATPGEISPPPLPTIDKQSHNGTK